MRRTELERVADASRHELADHADRDGEQDDRGDQGADPPVGEQAPEVAERGAQVGRPEEDPADHDEVEDPEPGEPRVHGPVLDGLELRGHDQGGVVAVVVGERGRRDRRVGLRRDRAQPETLRPPSGLAGSVALVAAPSTPARALLVAHREPALDREPRAVEGAPDHEGPARSVPQAAEQHRQEEVAVLRPRPATVAAERDVQVVAQPARQRHVPATPELLDRPRRVRLVEVVREADAHEHREADRHVGVPGEVRVDLHRVRPRADEQLQVGVLAGCDEDGIDDRGREEVRDHDLLEQTAADQPHGTDRVDPVRVAAASQLRGELRHAHDRPGDEVREERQVHGEVDQGDRFLVAAEDVDQVADRAEREERDADGQQHLDEQRAGRQAQRLEQPEHRVDEEAVVLEEAEEHQVEADADEHPALLGDGVASAEDRLAEEPVADGRSGEQEAEVPVGPAVEHVAGRQQEEAPFERPVVELPGHPQHDDEEERERHRGEEHRSPPGRPRRPPDRGRSRAVRTRRSQPHH